MGEQKFINAVGNIRDEYLLEALPKGQRKKKAYIIISRVAAAMITLALIGAFSIKIPTQPNEPSGLIADNTSDNIQSNVSENSKEIQISMSSVFVNQIVGLTDSSKVLPDTNLYDEIVWNKEDIINYYGKDLSPVYIPEELIASSNNETETVFIGKDNMMVDDTVCLQFYTDYYEDGSPKPNGNTSACEGFTITASKLGILSDCFYLKPDKQIEITNIEGTDVIIGYQNVSCGPYDEETHEPTGYYDMYVVTFSLDDAAYQFVFEQMDLKEVIKVVTSAITGENEIEIVN